MPQNSGNTDTRNTLNVLKAELNFVTKGGYGRSPREPWRAQLFLEDSPTCMNYDAQENRAACSECLLAQFVADSKRGEKVLCRHIPITSKGETLMEMYRGWTEAEIEQALAKWLQKTIAELESQDARKAQPKI